MSCRNEETRGSVCSDIKPPLSNGKPEVDVLSTGFEDFSVAFIKGDLLTLCISGSGQVITMDLWTLRNSTIEQLEQKISANKLEQSIIEKTTAGPKFLMTNLSLLRDADDVILIPRSSARSMRAALKVCPIFNRYIILREVSLFGLGKVIRDSMTEKRLKLHYENRIIEIETGDGVIEIVDETACQDRHERDLKYMILGLLCQIKIWQGTLKDNLPLINLGHNLDLIVTEDEIIRDRVPLLTTNTTIPATSTKKLYVSTNQTVSLYLDDEILVKELPITIYGAIDILIKCGEIDFFKEIHITDSQGCVTIYNVVSSIR